MNPTIRGTFRQVFILLSAGLIGCGSPAKQPVGDTPISKQEADASGAPKEKYAESFAGLSAEDRKAAREQKVCVVGGGDLGSMGTPYKVTIKGQDVYLCCEHCEEELKKDPDKYLAQLHKK